MENNKIVIPIKDIVLFEKVLKGETDGGIVLPDTVKRDDGFRVLNVGPEVKDVEKGDFIAYMGTSSKTGVPTCVKIEMEGLRDALYLIKEEYVVAKIKTV